MSSCSSSVTPQPGYHIQTKIHPVMSKYQAHMALASESQRHKLKLQQNYGFSPPSQLVSNYANFGPATSNPFWHSGFSKQNGMYHHVHDHRDFNPSYHLSSGPENQQYQQNNQQSQSQQNQQQQYQSQQQNNQQQQIHQNNNQEQQEQNLQNQPIVHPSVLTPFLEQVHLKQKEAAAEQKNAHKPSQEPTSNENNGSYEIINDVFSKNLVPPPMNSPQNFKQPSKQQAKEEKTNKYNLAMKSPLQDATRFNYENVISTAVTPTPYDPQRFKPSASDNTYLTTDKPKVFGNLNRPRDNVYKQHKLLHPSYTGSAKRKPAAVEQKPFLPTPYKPEKEEEIKIDEFEPQHSYFTIEDAVTPKVLSYHVVKGHVPVDENPETFTFNYPQKTEDESLRLPLATPSVTSTIEEQTPKPKQKLRRRKPKPKQPIVVEEQKREEVREKPTVKPNQLRGSIRNVDTQPQQNDFRSKKRVNSVRNKINFSSPAATLTTFDYDATVRPSTEEVKLEEITTVHHFTTESPTSAKSDESSERPENLKRRVRLRYKNKLRQELNSVEQNEFKVKAPNQISEAESENVPVKQSTESYEQNIRTENSFNETRSTLKLPNLKLRNEILTTFTSNVESLSSVAPSETTAPAQDATIHNKIANRPKFSIKEIKRKQLSPSSTTTNSFATTTTTVKPDGQRFNRLRVSLNRRRNETTESTEEVSEAPERKFSSSRPATTTESTIQTSPKRGTLPKRTFPPRNFTKPVATESETTTSLKPSTKTSSAFNTNRTIPSLRSRIQSYKKKETLADVEETTAVPTRKSDVILVEASDDELPVTTSSTELPPIKHETSIMKIAKTPSTVNIVKSTTSNSIDEPNETSRSDSDLTGSPSEHSQRVAELTISGNDNYSFKSANIGPLSRRIPNYFTISTDDPILPIQAFFPQIKTNEEANFSK